MGSIPIGSTIKLFIINDLRVDVWEPRSRLAIRIARPQASLALLDRRPSQPSDESRWPEISWTWSVGFSTATPHEDSRWFLHPTGELATLVVEPKMGWCGCSHGRGWWLDGVARNLLLVRSGASSLFADRGESP